MYCRDLFNNVPPSASPHTCTVPTLHTYPPTLPTPALLDGEPPQIVFGTGDGATLGGFGPRGLILLLGPPLPRVTGEGEAVPSACADVRGGGGRRGLRAGRFVRLFTVLAITALLLCMTLFPGLPSILPSPPSPPHIPTCRVPRSSDGHDGAVVTHARHKGVGRHPGSAADHPLDHLGSSSNLRGGGKGVGGGGGVWRGRGREGKAVVVTQGVSGLPPSSTLCHPDHHPRSHSITPPIIVYPPPPLLHLGVVQGQLIHPSPPIIV